MRIGIDVGIGWFLPVYLYVVYRLQYVCCLVEWALVLHRDCFLEGHTRVNCLHFYILASQSCYYMRSYIHFFQLRNCILHYTILPLRLGNGSSYLGERTQFELWLVGSCWVCCIGGMISGGTIWEGNVDLITTNFFSFVLSEPFSDTPCNVKIQCQNPCWFALWCTERIGDNPPFKRSSQWTPSCALNSAEKDLWHLRKCKKDGSNRIAGTVFFSIPEHHRTESR